MAGAGVASVPKATRGTRQDPRPSRVEAVGSFQVILKFRDPNLHYVWVSKTSKLLGINYYLGMGYDVVRYTPEGVRPQGTRRQRKFEEVPLNEPIEYMDSVLMAIPLEDHLDIEKTGPDGVSGQDLATTIESRLLDRKSVMRDTMRGMGSNVNASGDQYFNMEVETTPIAVGN